MRSRDEDLKIYLEKQWKLLDIWEINESGECACERENCHAPGKHPVKGPDFARVYRSTLPLRHNVGVLCGEGFCVLDIDPRNGGNETLAALEAEHGALPQTWTVATGGGGEHRYFSVPGSQPAQDGLKAQGLELKGVGRYVLCPSSNHASGRLYEWMVEPEDCELAPLPDWVLEVTKSQDALERSETLSEQADFVSERYSLEDVQCALKYIDSDCSEKEWKDIACALISGGFSVELFDSWSYSAADKYPGKEEIEKVWNKQAERMRKAPIGRKITLGTLIHRAKQAGWNWEPPQIECPIAFSGPTEPPPEVVHEVSTCITTEPKGVDWPPGLIGEIAQEIYAVANSKSKKFAIAASISTVSMIAQGNYHSPIKKGYLSSYYGLIAPASWGKESYTSLPHKILMDVAKWLKCGQLQSPQALRRKLHTCNSLGIVEDEILLWLKQMVELDSPLQSDFLTLWGSSTNYLDSKETKNAEETSPAIQCPRVSIIGGGTPDTFYSMLSKKGADLTKNGLLSRFDFIIVEKNEKPGREDNDFFLHGELFQLLFAIAGNPKKAPIEVDPAKKNTTQRYVYDASIKVQWDFGARDRWYDLRDEWAKRSDNPLTGSLWNRAAEKVLRVACLLAITEEPKLPAVRTCHIRWAEQWQESLTTNLEAVLIEKTGRSEEVDLKEEIMNVFREKKITQMTLRELRRCCWPARGAEHSRLMKAIDALVAEESIIKGKGGRKDSIVVALANK